ncbi:MAG TPA: hypothetical protein VIC30_11940, partial [Orrella sp.]
LKEHTEMANEIENRVREHFGVKPREGTVPAAGKSAGKAADKGTDKATDKATETVTAADQTDAPEQ